MNDLIQFITGDCLEELRKLPDQSVQCCVTSPPYYGLRDYGVNGQVGLEETPEMYVSRLVNVFTEVKRVLRDDGTLWLNLGDSYNARNGQRGIDDTAGWKQSTNTASRNVPSRSVPSCKPKDLIGIPWMVAFALRSDGWYLRSDIIWHKPNPMPESVTDRPTRSHEYIFLLSKSQRYYYDHEAIKDKPSPELIKQIQDGYNGQAVKDYLNSSVQDALTPAEQSLCGRNKRDVWTVAPACYREVHFATFPPKLIEPCILAGCPSGGTVLDPFGGSGTTALAAVELHRKAILIELNPAYTELAKKRCRYARPIPQQTELAIYHPVP